MMTQVLPLEINLVDSQFSVQLPTVT